MPDRSSLRWCLLLAVAGAAAIGSGGCERSRPESSPAARPAAGPSAAATPSDDPSPLAVIERLHQHRVEGRVEAAAALVIPEQQAAVVDLMLAVDALVDANRALQRVLTERLGPSQALAFDRSRARNAIGVLSADIRIVDERIEGERAVVTVQVAERLPLEEVTLVRRASGWRVQTDPPIPGLSEELLALARVLEEVARRVEEKNMTYEEVRDELARRQAPIGERLAALLNREEESSSSGSAP